MRTGAQWLVAYLAFAVIAAEYFGLKAFAVFLEACRLFAMATLVVLAFQAKEKGVRDLRDGIGGHLFSPLGPSAGLRAIQSQDE
jgi:hypothetical protein